MGDFGYEESYEERITIGPDGKPVRHIKKVRRDLTEDEAKKLMEKGPVAGDAFGNLDDAFKHMDEVFKSMDRVFGRMFK